MKDKLLKCLETMTKAELSKEIGISSQTLTKILSQGLSSVRIDSFNK